MLLLLRTGDCVPALRSQLLHIYHRTASQHFPAVFLSPWTMLLHITCRYRTNTRPGLDLREICIDTARMRGHIGTGILKVQCHSVESFGEWWVTYQFMQKHHYHSSGSSDFRLYFAWSLNHCRRYNQSQIHLSSECQVMRTCLYWCKDPIFSPIIVKNYFWDTRRLDVYHEP
jgi:hypothetical protein